jgi:hypothetical protein
MIVVTAVTERNDRAGYGSKSYKPEQQRTYSEPSLSRFYRWNGNRQRWRALSCGGRCIDLWQHATAGRRLRGGRTDSCSTKSRSGRRIGAHDTQNREGIGLGRGRADGSNRAR